LGDEAAVEYIKQGAADYVLKHRLERLPVAVRQALRDKAHREESARLQEQILAGKREWELTFDSVTSPVMLLGLKGEILRANQAVTQVTGKKFSEFIGRPCREVFPCEDGNPLNCPHRVTLETGGFSRREELVKVNGLLLECTASPLRDPSGNLSGTVIVLHDLTERRRGEIALRESEERFRTAFRASPQPMSISRLADGRYVDVNEAFLRFIGFDRETVIGHTARELNIWVDLEGRNTILLELQERRPVRDAQYDFRTLSGEIRTALLSAEPVEMSGEMCALVISVDVTERRRLEQQFLQAQKMEAVGRLAGGVAHDFNNLLTIINGYTELMLQGGAPGSRERSHLEEIRRAGERASALTRQLLAFSRKQVVVPLVLDLNSVAEGIRKMLRRLIREDIEFQTNLASGLGQIKADAGQVEQVIMNLAVNSRDAMPKGGKVILETANVELDSEYCRSHPYVTPGRYVMLALSDTGCGMDSETQAHIFEPFFTTKDSGKGSGLGLSTVYGIVKQSGGHIHVYSEVGRGTTIRVYFPRIDEAGEGASAPGALQVPEGGHETILLVEDEPGVRGLTESALRSNGYTVWAACDSAEALSLWEKRKDAIGLHLTDVVLPGMSGKELADRLKAHRPDTKVLFISGYTADAIARHGILEEGVAFLAKPSTPRELLAKLRQTLDG
ncbi:MAG TPA: PAS domain S-box protein, partial [Terriglobia bacterium]|nr:PAS domain S-box protein [Terriglobia bacterium]